MNRCLRIMFLMLTMLLLTGNQSACAGEDVEDGFVSLFNGKDLSGWQGATDMFYVKDGVLFFCKGMRGHIYTDKEYTNFVLKLEFCIEPGGNNGVGLRTELGGKPSRKGMEVQILDDYFPDYKDLKPEQYCGAIYGVAAPKRGYLKPAGQWNTMEIRADGPHVTVKLNGELINDVDLSTMGTEPKEIHNAKIEGFWRPKGHIALCGHRKHTEFRNVRVKELDDNADSDSKDNRTAGDVGERQCEEGFVSLFNGKDLSGWQGATDAFIVEDGVLISKKKCYGNLFTIKQYSDFVLQLQFRNEPGGNNGVGLRATLEGIPAYTGMEIQILDDKHPSYKDLRPEQYCGAIYGVAAPKRGYLKPAGQWNAMDIRADGPHVTVKLNGEVITDADLSRLGPKKIHGQALEGLMRLKGYIALCGHDARTEFRNLRIKELINSPKQ